MKKSFLLFGFLFILSIFQINAQEVDNPIDNVDTLQFNYNLTKSDNIQWIEDELMYLHIVALKQTLFSISKLYNISIDEILLINKLNSADDIKAGQILLIPARNLDPKKYPKKESEQKTQTDEPNHLETSHNLLQDTLNYYYVYVKQKETLYHLSHEYNVDIDDIKKANDGLLDGLKAYTTIRIPKPKKIEEVIEEEITVSIPENLIEPAIIIDTVAVKLVEHIVQPRETLYKIAKEYSISTDDIIKYNPSAAKRVKKNQVLLIPVYQIEQEEIKIETGIISGIDTSTLESITVDIEDLEVIKSKRKFKVALLMPLYFEEDRNLTVDEITGKIVSGTSKPFRFIQFYQGAKIALDSLAKAGMNVDLQIFDVDESYSKAQKLVNNNALKDFDLIIGPFYKQAYNLICNYVSKFGIPIVNPTTALRENVCDYDKTFKLTVDNTTKLSYIANYILVNYPDANIVFYFQKTPTESQKEEMQYLQNRLDKAIPERIKFSNVDLYNLIVEQSVLDSTLSEGQIFKNIYLENILLSKNELIEHPAEFTYVNNNIKIFDYSISGVAGYTKYLSPARANIVISFTEDNSGIIDNLSRLNSLAGKYEIHLFGNEYWLMSELDYQSLRNVDFHICTNRLIDYNDIRVNDFINNYSQVFISEPGRYAFLGFDIVYYFGKMLYLFDNDFTKYISTVKYNGLEYSMFYNKTTDISGFENFSSGIYVIRNYQWLLMPSDDYIWNRISVDLETIR
ncbi:MAG: LysM peptidoglycan-binding domain-containing protein [Bacteroidales bacterium]|jgi:LysM repeat protein|nr:LysM peptidoglycan-binding domain-containing protein [Bacteroidales bacterium]